MRDVEVRGLSKSFGGRVLFRRLNLTFRAGEITVLAGENGVGKTTLLRMMLGLERPDSGEISGLPDARSALFQEDRLLPDLSAARNVALGCRRPPPLGVPAGAAPARCWPLPVPAGDWGPASCYCTWHGRWDGQAGGWR